MLTVHENGVNITLQPGISAPPLLRTAVVVAVIIAVIGALMAFGLLSALIGALLIAMTLIGSYTWHYFAQSHNPTLLSGGNLSLTPYEFRHQAFGRTVNYRLQPSDSVRLLPMGNSANSSQPMILTIQSGDGKVLYKITGFSDVKHQQIAQAVLQGKSVQAQGKAIRLNPTD